MIATDFPSQGYDIFSALSLNNQLKKTLPVKLLKIRTICHAQDLWQLAWSSKQLHLLCPPNLYNVPGTALLSEFQSSHGALKSTEQDST